MTLLDKARLTYPELRAFSQGRLISEAEQAIADAATRKAIKAVAQSIRKRIDMAFYDDSNPAKRKYEVAILQHMADYIEAALGANPRLRAGVPDFIGGEVVTQSHEVTDEG